MRVFVTGATGAVGRHLVPGLVGSGHQVTATTRSPGKVDGLRAAGAEPVVVDGLDRDGVIAAVRAAEPEVIVHQMTALSEMGRLRHVDQEFAATSALRTRGTDNLLAAAKEVGARRVVAQGHNFIYARTGTMVKTEDDPLDPRPVPSAVEAMAAIRYLDRVVPESVPEGLVLRYGTFYGPGASDQFVEGVRKRQLPIIGGGTGVWSFIETFDAASAAQAAVEGGPPGVYNVVDDEPAPVSEWLPYLADLVGAKPPMRLPVWLGRLLAGEFIVTQMTQARGASNAKARAELAWTPKYPSWRDGFRTWVHSASR
ncbi:NAD-dependent epimerase/dehydratase family protein [Asanoa iriomotensis]|uniref:NAD(P)-dependent oxidoreductase n=1 Tax=Asanoa iriomotensis TaxID=234613 RepID=A0ABQ4CDX5_9ACTN|nr:NAD(P)-dependent oxidoreductase [Asanoa iriomotensis]GIF60972.1 NAD(P)-dependent oxidoreductase [Asanoa iriomotensis]